MFKKPAAIAIFAAAVCGVHANSLAASPGETVAAFHQALAGGDRDKALSFMSPQVAIYESGYVERSRDEYAGYHLGSDMDFVRNASRKVVRQSERIDGKLAVVWEETETTGTWKDKPLHVLGTETAVLEKTGDSWKIVHVHWSSRKAK